VNIKEYISSGIIESYVLGLASEEERAEFEQLCLQYPELVTARNEFEEKLEQQAFKQAITPPAFLKQVSPPKEAKIITMDTKPRNTGLLRFVAAASVILFLAAGYFAYNLYNKNKDLKQSNTDLEAKISRIDSAVNSMKEEQEMVQNAVRNPNTTVVTLAALKQNPNPPSAAVYWDTASASVFLLVKNMPQLPSDKQYQLWSIIDNAGKLKPTSLGLFDGGNEKLMLRMDKSQKADAFAITVENRGNPGGPNLEQLQVMGKPKL
jgi:anti-sigma-K factor RskA